MLIQISVSVCSSEKNLLCIHYSFQYNPLTLDINETEPDRGRESIISSVSMARSVQEERENKKWSTPKDPLATAIVYNSYKNPEQCGPPLPLNRVVRYLHSSSSSSDGNHERKDHNRLPLGQVPIAYVEDGLVSEKKHPTVTFKFGKIVYRLSVPDQGREPSSPSVFLTPLWMKWMPILGVYSSSSCLEQKRIAQALEMHDQSMKVRGYFRG